MPCIMHMHVRCKNYACCLLRSHAIYRTRTGFNMNSFLVYQQKYQKNGIEFTQFNVP